MTRITNIALSVVTVLIWKAIAWALGSWLQLFGNTEDQWFLMLVATSIALHLARDGSTNENAP